jgi:hypothetical protein
MSRRPAAKVGMNVAVAWLHYTLILQPEKSR